MAIRSPAGVSARAEPMDGIGVGGGVSAEEFTGIETEAVAGDMGGNG